MKKIFKRAAALVLTASMALTAAGVAFAAETQEQTSVTPFTDVPQNAWYTNFVDYTYQNNLFAGTSATTFSPKANMTRAQMATVICKMHYELVRTNPISEKIVPAFKDVTANEWYAYYIGWVQKNNIMSGYGDGKFHPNDPITREMIATVVSNYLAYVKCNLEGTREIDYEYTDWDQIANWAKPAVKNLTDHGIMCGDANHGFAPKRNMIRAEAATIITRIYQELKYPTASYAKYQSIRYSKTPAEGETVSMLDGASYKILTTYNDYIALVDKVKADECSLTGETTAFTPGDKTFFRNGDILAVEVQHPGAVKYQTKLAGLFVDQQADNKSKLDVSVTLFGRDADAEGESAEAVGYVFFIQVPNNVDTVSITEAFRVEG